MRKQRKARASKKAARKSAVDLRSAEAPKSEVAPRLTMLDLVSPFDTSPPPPSKVTPLVPPASSPALERASDAYANRADELPVSQRPTMPAPRALSTTMLPPPLPLEEASEEVSQPVSHERVKAAELPLVESEDEQRSSPRVALEVELHVASDSHFFTGLSGDISEGGVFVSTYRSLSIGSEVDLEFTLPTSWQRVRARGRVRWHRQASPGTPPGVGIAFEEIDEIDRNAIERFCTTHPPLYYDDVG